MSVVKLCDNHLNAEEMDYMKVMYNNGVGVASIGRILTSLSKKHGLSKNVIFNGLGCSPNYLIMDNQGNNSLSLRTLFLQEMMKEKILIPYIALSFSHGDSEMERTLLALDKSFGVIKKAIGSQVDDYLDSEVVKPVFRKYN